jgi:hypothetical protein
MGYVGPNTTDFGGNTPLDYMAMVDGIEDYIDYFDMSVHDRNPNTTSQATFDSAIRDNGPGETDIDLVELLEAAIAHGKGIIISEWSTSYKAEECNGEGNKPRPDLFVEYFHDALQDLYDAGYLFGESHLIGGCYTPHTTNQLYVTPSGSAVGAAGRAKYAELF